MKKTNSRGAESKESKESFANEAIGDLPGWCHINFDDIVLGDRIGGGGVGIIYKGWLRGEEVALKTLFDPRVDERLKKEYLDELLVMSKVKHSNIVSFLGACMTPPDLCFVMELCEDSLFQLLHVQRISFTERECLQMNIDIASAMEYLHSLKPCIIHRDLKSHNVLRSFNGALKLCDFGLVSVRNSRAGTPAYMAPELIEGLGFNKSVDVYAFGILMCEIFSQEIPFYMIDSNEIRRKVVAGDRPRLPSYGCPMRCVKLITQSWSAYTEERESFTSLLDQLIEIYDDTPESKHTEILDYKGYGKGSSSTGGGGGDSLDSLLYK